MLFSLIRQLRIKLQGSNLNLLLPSILSLLIVFNVTAQNTDMDSNTVLDILSSKDNPRNSEGSFVTLKDGRILFVYSRFMQSTSDHAPAQLMGRFSEDNGATWSMEDHLIVDREGDMNVMSVSLLRLYNGNIALFYMRKNSMNDCTLYVRISTDEAKSWSEPKSIIEDQTGYFVTNNDRVIQHSSGRILVPVSLHKTAQSIWSNSGELRCYYSDDDGQTWIRGRAVPSPSEHITQEPGLIELQDSSLMMFIRASGGKMMRSFSKDMGYSWTLAEKTNVPAPIAPTSIKRLPQTGDLFMAWIHNGESGPGYFKTKRSPLTMAVSKDDGKTWQHIQNVEYSPEATYSYTAIHAVDDYVLLGYYFKADAKPGFDIRIKRYSMDEVYTEKDLDPVLVVANKHSNTLSYVNPVTKKVLESIDIGNNPHEIAITPDQRFAYLSSYEAPGNQILVVDLQAREQVKTISTGEVGRIHGVTISPDGLYAYFTAGQSGYVIEVDTRTQEITRKIPTHGKISHMVYISPDSRYLLTANIVSENISLIERTSGKLIKQIPAGKGVEGMAFTPDGRFLWALNQTGASITIIDVATWEAVENLPCPGMPVRIVFIDGGKRALVAGWQKEGSLTVIDVEKKKEIKRIKVGDYAIGIEVSPDQRYAFVGCEDSLEPEILPNGSERIKSKKEDSDGVHVVDLQTLKVVHVIKTGLGPDPMSLWYPPSTIEE
ncbi:hypothetical protein GCM10025777_21440 [Membranihabitans marinus]